MKTEICEKCGQAIKPPKPDLIIGQKLWACLGWDNNKIKYFEVAEETNKKSLRIKCFDDDGSPWILLDLAKRTSEQDYFLQKKKLKKIQYNKKCSTS